MLTLRPAQERGHAEFGWLSARHSFSFGHYFDPRFTGFSDLLVINDDRIAPSGGFPMHGHRDMEIITWVLEGELEHQDSMGHRARVVPGEVQYMRAGSGVRHSEYNASAQDSLRLLQIWIQPQTLGLTPTYQQIAFSAEELHNRLHCIAAPHPTHRSVTLAQDAYLYAGRFEAGVAWQHTLAMGRCAYLQLARGELVVNGIAMQEGDGLFVEQETQLDLLAEHAVEVLLFDLRHTPQS